jgi:hypothetical protein
MTLEAMTPESFMGRRDAFVETPASLDQATRPTGG